jgi:hypothetical protein
MTKTRRGAPNDPPRMLRILTKGQLPELNERVPLALVHSRL